MERHIDRSAIATLTTWIRIALVAFMFIMFIVALSGCEGVKRELLARSKQPATAAQALKPATP